MPSSGGSRTSRRCEARLTAAGLLGASLWAAALVWAPHAAARPEPGPAPLAAAAAVYVLGSAVCHQLPERSLHLGAGQLPVCARCAGLYAGAPAGLLAVLLAGRRRPLAGLARNPARARMPLAAAAAPLLLTVAGEALGLLEPSNLARAATGVPAGAACAGLVGLLALRRTGSME